MITNKIKNALINELMQTCVKNTPYYLTFREIGGFQGDSKAWVLFDTICLTIGVERGRGNQSLFIGRIT